MINWLLITTIAGSTATLLLLWLRTGLVRKLGGNWFYYGCLAALLLFVVPIHLPISIDMSVPGALTPSVDTGTGDTGAVIGEDPGLSTGIGSAPSSQEVVSPADPQPPSEESGQLGSAASGNRFLSKLPAFERAILFIWLAGLVLMLSRYLFSYLRFKSKLLRHSRPMEHPPQGNMLLEAAGKVQVVLSDYVQAPMLIGFLRPIVVFPDRVIGQQQYELALQHELNHYRQGDAWIKLAAAVINALHWFNPFVYLAVANIHEACEYSCDERTIRQMEATQKQQYSEMILDFVSQPAPILSSSLARNKKQLYRRFQLIIAEQSGKGRYLGIAIVASIIVAAIVIASLVWEPASVADDSSDTGITTAALIENLGNSREVVLANLQLEEEDMEEHILRGGEALKEQQFFYDEEFVLVLMNMDDYNNPDRDLLYGFTYIKEFAGDEAAEGYQLTVRLYEQLTEAYSEPSTFPTLDTRIENMPEYNNLHDPGTGISFFDSWEQDDELLITLRMSYSSVTGILVMIEHVGAVRNLLEDNRNQLLQPVAEEQITTVDVRVEGSDSSSTDSLPADQLQELISWYNSIPADSFEELDNLEGGSGSRTRIVLTLPYMDRITMSYNAENEDVFITVSVSPPLRQGFFDTRYYRVDATEIKQLLDSL